jgi:hypothetical protein
MPFASDFGILLELHLKTISMKQSNSNRSDRQADQDNNAQQIGKDRNQPKGNISRKGDTSRSSNQGRKEASGGSKDTNNQGRPKG